MEPKPIPTETAPLPEKKPKSIVQYAGFLIAVVVTVLIFAFRDRLQDVEVYGYPGIFFISILGNATIILPVPTVLAALIGGSIFNPLLVAIVAGAGATIGELTGYVAGLSGKAVVENQVVYDRFQDWMQRYGLLALFVLAAIPNPFFDVAGIIAGISRIPLPTYLLITWGGKIIKFLIFAYVGAGSVSLIDKWF